MRPTEIDESLVYVVEYKVSGKEAPGNHCSLHGTAFSAAKKSLTTDTTDSSVHTASNSAPIKGEQMSEASAQKIKTLKVSSTKK